MAMTEKGLAAFELARQGDINGFVGLYKLSVQQIYNLAVMLLCDISAAEAAVEDVYRGAFKRLADMNDPASFDLWLQRAVINYCRKRTGRAPSFVCPDTSQGEDVGQISLPSVYASSPEYTGRLYEAAKKLDYAYREVLTLNCVNELTVEESASVLPADPDVVIRCKNAALRELSEILAALERESGDTFADNPIINYLPAEQTLLSASVMLSIPKTDSAKIIENVLADKIREARQSVPAEKSPDAPSPENHAGGNERQHNPQRSSSGRNPQDPRRKASPPVNKKKKKKKKGVRRLNGKLFAAVAVLLVFGFVVGLAVAISRSSADKEQPSSVVIVPGQKTDLDVNRLPSGLTELLNSFCPYLEGKAGSEYQSEKAGSGESNLLYQLMQYPPCCDYSAYDLDEPRLSDDGSSDPYWYAADKRFTICSDKSLNWAAVNVFNCSDEVYDKLREDGVDNKLFYAYGNDYYCVAPENDYFQPLVEPTGAMFDGTYYFVTYNKYVGKLLKSYYGDDYTEAEINFEEIRSIIKHDTLYAVLQYKENAERKYWSLLANSKDKSVFDKYSAPSNPNEAGEDTIFAVLPPQFVLSVGNDDWKTLININKDGTFQGYHVTNKPESGNGYTSTVYESFFNGKFGNVKKLNSYSFHMELMYVNTDYPEGQETVSNNVRHVSFKPIGFEKGVEFLLYLPGSEADKVPPEHVNWLNSANVIDGGKINVFSLYNLEGKYGFYAPGTAQTIPAHASSRAWSAAYKDFLLEERYLQLDQEFFDEVNKTAALYDAGTGIPYLLISTGSASSAAQGYRVYKYSSGTVSYVGTTGADIYMSSGTSFKGIFSKITVTNANVEQALRDEGVQYYDLIDYSDILADSFIRTDVIRKEYYDYSGKSKTADLCSNHGLVTAASGELIKIETTSIYTIKQNGWDSFAAEIE